VKRKARAPGANYGMIAEKRVDRSLAWLQSDGVIHFWFRADKTLDAEGADHIFGIITPKFIAWVLQVSSGKVKRRTYYRKTPHGDPSMFKKPYYRRRYHRYIPLLAVTSKIPDAQLRRKLKSISRTFISIFENKHCPDRLKRLLIAFLIKRDVPIPQELVEAYSLR